MNTVKHTHGALILVFGLCLALPAGAADDGQLETVTVMALGPLDGRAVVKTADGKMQVLKIGDTVHPSSIFYQVRIDGRTIIREFKNP